MSRKDVATVRFRMLVFAASGFLFATVLLLRLLDLQVAKHDFLKEKAARQQEKAIKLPPERGFIFDRRGEILAASTKAVSVFAAPKEVKDRSVLGAKLVAILGGRSSAWRSRLDPRKSFAWIARNVPLERVEALRKHPPRGIYFLPASRRIYPKGRLAANLLGYVGVDGDGLAGIEARYDRYVQGTPGMMMALRNAKGSLYRKVVMREPVPGMDLHLTIDSVIQHVAEAEVKRSLEETGARGVAAIVMDPRSGRILAMASAPSFDPNEYRRFTPASWRNRAIQDTFEPGSTFKVFTAASALDNGVVKPWETIDCGSGSIMVGTTRIRDHNSYDELTFKEIIAKSSNVGAIRVGLRLPSSVFYRDILAFGFGRKTSIDLPGEARGMLKSGKRWTPLLQASIAMGQGIGATPLQMTTAMAAVASGGELHRPFVVERVVDASGRIRHENEPEVVGHPLTRETASILAEILKGVVTEGTGKRAAIPGFDVAGKTGTAQKVVNGRYSHRKFVASFVGFVPARNACVAIGVFIDEPKGAYYGGRVAAPVFRRIGERALRCMGVPAGGPALPASDKRLRMARVYLPSGESLAPAPPTSVLTQEEKVRLQDDGTAPDLVGLTLRDAYLLCRAVDLRLAVRGRGKVVRQDPPPGGEINKRAVTAFFEGG